MLDCLEIIPEVIDLSKTQKAAGLTTVAPSVVEVKQLREWCVKLAGAADQK
jgi:aspartyl-tRNA synthetase